MSTKTEELKKDIERIQDKQFEEGMKRAKWQNVLFNKQGKSHRGYSLWETKDAAIKAYHAAISKAVTYKGGVDTLDGVVAWNNIGYTIQLPVL